MADFAAEKVHKKTDCLENAGHSPARKIVPTILHKKLTL
jgi:hypothetical protein